MVTLENERFGTVQIPDEAVIRFEDGLYGFEDCHQFALLPVEAGNPRLQWLQSLDDPALAWLILDPSLIRPDYAPVVDAQDLQGIGLGGLEEGIVMVICVLAANLQDVTANLQAPLVFNPAARQGRQVILLDPSLPVRQPVLAASAG